MLYVKTEYAFQDETLNFFDQLLECDKFQLPYERVTDQFREQVLINSPSTIELINTLPDREIYSLKKIHKILLPQLMQAITGTSVKSLDLAFNQFNEDTLMRILENLPVGLEKIYLEGNPFFDDIFDTFPSNDIFAKDVATYIGKSDLIVLTGLPDDLPGMPFIHTALAANRHRLYPLPSHIPVTLTWSHIAKPSANQSFFYKIGEFAIKEIVELLEDFLIDHAANNRASPSQKIK